MTRFLDGPAQGKTLMLTRAPAYLRVVIAADGKVDALNQPEDSPRADERLYAYLAHGERGTVHLNIRGGRGGFYALAEYKIIAEQPSDEIMRDASLWQQWVERHHSKK